MFCFPSFLSSFAERFLEIFDLVLGQVQKGFFFVVVASALTSISSIDPSAQSGTKAQATLAEQARLQSRSVLGSFGVVLMSCRVKFHVVRSALQYPACLHYYFC